MAHSTACPDWERRIVAGESLIPFEPLYPEEAEAALEVFKSLQITELPQFYDRSIGRHRHPTFGESCEQYVFDFVKAIFGAYDPKSAERKIEEFFLLIAKKNIKSTMAAAIMLTALIRNWRHHQELIIIAPTREVAGNSFDPAANMVRADPELKVLLHVQDNLKLITHETTHATLKVVSADSTTSAGKKAAFVLVEELWLFGKKDGASAMLQEACGGLISRPEGFVIYLSTQSAEPPAGVFKEKLDYFRDVRDGKIDDPHSLAVIYEFPEKMIEDESYLDPKNWYIPNPNMGRSVRRDWLERKHLNVKSGADEDGDTVQTFLAKHLNVEIGMRNRANRWAGSNFWIASADKSLKEASHFDAFDQLLERSEAVVIGIDGGGMDDLFGFAAMGREPEEHEVSIKVNGRPSIIRMKRWLLWGHAFCHRDVLKRRKKIAPRLLDFERSGCLTIIDEAIEDIATMVEMTRVVKDHGLLCSLAVDPACIGDFVEALAAPEIDVTYDNGLLVGIQQGFGLMNSIKTVERRLANGMMVHDGNPLMDWCVSNLKIEPTATAIRATKQTAGDAKIDPTIAMFNAAAVMVKNPMPVRHISIYEERELLVI